MDYKVYVHRRLDNDEIFYVGHGYHARAWAFTRGRSQAWQQIYNQSGCRVEIIARYSNKSDAAIHEMLYIAACKEQNIPIVNYRSGGFDRNQGVPKSDLSKEKIRQARLNTNGNAKKVKTPLGMFKSMAQAAQAHSMSLDQIYYRVKNKPGFELC